ncbi:MAG: ACP S-malonyltransferase [Rhodospirillaceae bacterium]
MRAFVFPGQGSQAVGMGQELGQAFASARAVFEEVDDALSQSLSTLMAEGPLETLTLTENAQPALMAVSMAVVRVLEQDCGVDLAKAAGRVAGHSLGEYSALAAAGTLSLSDTARLLKIRGKAMQEAVPVGVGAMAALIGLDLDVAREVAAEAEAAFPDGDKVCTAANDNAPGQVVVSGHKEAVEKACVIAKERGCRRPMMLPVSAPFHCSLMEPAAKVMAEALADVAFARPSVPLVANVTAETVSDPEVIRTQLVAQVTGAVRWRESVLHMVDAGVTELVELGSGKVLSGMAKRIHPELVGKSIQGPADVEAIAASL